ncbi:unnamed protein product [Calypogeia fissa]
MALSNSLTICSLTVFILLVVAHFLPANADIRVVNNCTFSLTVFYQSQNVDPANFSLPSNGTQQLNLTSEWLDGMIWASQNANPNKSQATKLDFAIGGFFNQDYYDLSLVRAYNLAAKILPTFLANGDQANGLHCGSPTCSIPDVNSVCRGRNHFEGPDHACINTDGPGGNSTEYTTLFQAPCPGVATYSSEPETVYACSSGSQYDVIFCPI